MLTSPTYIKVLLTKHGFKIRKRLGQNFLTDRNVVEKIVDAANISQDDLVIEIGPGIGTMTRVLAEKANRVVCVELDTNLLPILKETLADYDNVDIINQDALKVDFNQIAEKYNSHKYKVVANLPYYITTPLIMHLLESKFNISMIVVMVQKEVALRMAAKPGGKDYGALSVAVQYYSKPQLVFKVPPEVFLPKPEVESAVVRLEVADSPPVKLKDEKVFFRVVKAAFGQRRKTLLNALKNAGISQDKESILKILNECSIDPNRRGETLSIQEFASISNLIY